ncbi:hypothetical protein [Telluria beijingensis]|uniref:hypothetical protein n=1 Tax=Telluria beijingensis TaxID=3068633 RepID=UPI002795F89D|nr:hypothetical protein [Massilia sp. REN29]
MNKEDTVVRTQPEDSDYAQVPADFPRPVHLGAVPGAQLKLLMTQYDGRFYLPGCTPPEIFWRWDVCENLARHISAKSIESKAGKRSHMSEVEILDQYLPRLIATNWVSEEEAKWIVRRTAIILGWPVPLAAHNTDCSKQT